MWYLPFLLNYLWNLKAIWVKLFPKHCDCLMHCECSFMYKKSEVNLPLTGSVIRALHVVGRKFPLAAGNTLMSCSKGLNCRWRIIMTSSKSSQHIRNNIATLSQNKSRITEFVSQCNEFQITGLVPFSKSLNMPLMSLKSEANGA